MRSFDVHAASIALDVSSKWLDNLLSHHHVPGVLSERQGVRRRVQPDAILRIAIALLLIRELGVPTHRALTAAERLIVGGAYTGPSGLELRVDVPSLNRELAARLHDAAEAAPPRRRGRPPRRAGDRSRRPG